MVETNFSELSREPTLTARVIGQIEELILANHLRPGDRLPVERKLAAQFGVSKTVVREAMAALAARGMLTVGERGGAIVRTPSIENVTRSMTLFLRGSQTSLDYATVHEVRRVLEVEIAGLAAARRTEEDVARLQAILGRMEALGTADHPDHIEADVQFHTAIAQATHNPLFPVVLDSVVEIMRDVRRLGSIVPGVFENGRAHHRAILEQIRARDVNGARQAMLSHILDSEDIMRRGQILAQAAGKEKQP